MKAQMLTTAARERDYVSATAAVIDGWSVDPFGEPGPLLRECLQAAVAAPSIHNTQPWRFRVTPLGVDVLADRSRRLQVIDPAGRELFMSVGAAVLNLRVAMLAHGRQPVLRLLPDGPGSDLVARVTPGAYVRPTETARMLAAAIPRRHTNRRPFADVPVAPHLLVELAQAAGVEGAALAVADEAGRDVLLATTRAAEAHFRREPRYWMELAGWTSWTRDRTDGVPQAAFGPLADTDAVPMRDFGLVHPGTGRRVEQFESTPTLAVLTTSTDDRADWVRAGQALQRVLLTATVRGLASSLMTQPVEMAGLRALLCGWRRTDRVAQAIVRVGYGPPAAPSPRRSLDEVVVLRSSVPVWR
jgi:nitroreductase